MVFEGFGMPDNCRTSAGQLPDKSRTSAGQLSGNCPAYLGSILGTLGSGRFFFRRFFEKKVKKKRAFSKGQKPELHGTGSAVAGGRTQAHGEVGPCSRTLSNA